MDQAPQHRSLVSWRGARRLHDQGRHPRDIGDARLYRRLAGRSLNDSFSRIDARTIRLIASADHKPPVLQPLAASFGGLEKLAELEGVTSGRLAVQQKGLPGMAPDMLATGYGYTF